MSQATVTAVGVAVDNTDDLHAAVVFYDGKVLYANASEPLRRGSQRELQDTINALTLISFGQWRQLAGGGGAPLEDAQIPDDAGKCAALAGATAAASDDPIVVMDLAGATEPEEVAARIRSVVGDLDRVIRSQAKPPASPSRVLLGTRLSRNGERADPKTGKYTPGPGYEALLRSVPAEQVSMIEAALRARAAQAV